MKTFSHLSVWALVLLWACSLTLTAQPVLNGYVAGTCYGGSNSAYVVALYDMRLAHLQPTNTNWNAPVSHGPASSPWTRSRLGEVFGLCFDPAGNIYVSATIVYYNAVPGGPGGSGAIYRIDGVTGAISTFATLPNTGNVGLGNIAWDATNNQMFATNFEDGKIYRISSTGTVLSTFDPFVLDGGTSGLAPYGELLWGVGVNNNRVYFGRWNENSGNASAVLNNQVWSVALNGSGNFTGSETLEITMPSISSNYSNPISDIAFSESGDMLIAERGVSGTNPALNPTAHSSRVLEYTLSGTWVATGNIFSIGELGASGSNSAGGVDYAYGSYNQSTNEVEDCDDAVWASGDALDFYTPNVIYGWQRLPAGGGDVTTSQLVDADGNLTQQDKNQLGDIEVYVQCQQSDPCPNINITVNPLPTNECCFDLTFASFTAGTVASINANILTAGVTFSGVLGPGGWNATNSGTNATWDSAKCIPAGTASGLQFCIQSTVAPPQEIEIIYLLKDGTRCRDTIEVQCDSIPPEPCVVIEDREVECKEQGPNGWTYDLSFTVTNYSPFSPPYPAENVAVYSATPGVVVAPTLTALVPTLGYGATSGTLNYSLSGSGAQPGDSVCIVVQLHGAKLAHDYQWCCPPDTICFVLPDCRDCCDSVEISFTNNTGRQVGNTAASIASSLSVTPGPVMKMQASIMNVSRSRVWCPNSSTGIYTPVANATTIGGVIYNGSLTPSMPVASGFSPATSEVIWGTVYSGVNMSSGSVNLNLRFPGTNLGWRCRDTLTICMRYTFTDTAWVTCDTVVYYKIPRCGRIDIIAHDPDDEVISVSTATAGDGYTLNEPLYSSPVAGPTLDLQMASSVSGALSVSHWWQDQVIGVSKLRLVRMKLTPEAGIDITNVADEGGVRADIADRTATIAMDLRERETDRFNISFSNPTSADFFSVRVAFDYYDMDDPGETIQESREYIVYGDLSGGGPSSLSIREAEQSTPTLYKLLIESQGTHSTGWVAPSCFRFTPPEGVRIVASGPMQNDISSDFHVLRPIDRDGAMLMPLPSGTDLRGTISEQEDPLALWLVLEGSEDLVDLEWEALNAEGNPIAHGMLELSSTSTVRDGDDVVPGAAINLLDAWPNPADSRVNTRFNLHRSEHITVSVYDATGKEVTRVIDNQYMNAGWHQYDFGLGNLPDGVYYIRLKTEKGTQTKSIVKRD